MKVKKEHAINDADVLTLLIFAFGKMLITGGNSYNEILYVYRLFYNYLLFKQRYTKYNMVFTKEDTYLIVNLSG